MFSGRKSVTTFSGFLLHEKHPPNTGFTRLLHVAVLGRVLVAAKGAILCLFSTYT